MSCNEGSDFQCYQCNAVVHDWCNDPHDLKSHENNKVDCGDEKCYKFRASKKLSDDQNIN